MLKLIKNNTPSNNPPSFEFVATCADTGEKFHLKHCEISLDPHEDHVFVYGFVGKQLMFVHKCSSIHTVNERYVKKLPAVKVKTK